MVSSRISPQYQLSASLQLPSGSPWSSYSAWPLLQLFLVFGDTSPASRWPDSCSAAISAAYNGPIQIDTSVPLLWGVTSANDAETGNCAYLDRAVGAPEEGAHYIAYKKGIGSTS